MSIAVHAQPGTAEQRLDAGLQLLLRRKASVAQSLDTMRRLRSDATASSLTLLVKHTGNPKQLEQTGFRIQARIGNIYTGTIPLAALSTLADVPGVRYVQSSHRAMAYGTNAIDRTNARPHPPSVAFVPVVPSATGNGVLVAFVDTGADILHHDFRKSDGSTRIKYLLDFSTPGDTDGNGTLDGTGPYGGTLYDEEEINRQIASGLAASRDTTGHGTHGLSIAAGDDTVLPSFAPEADLIVVKATRIPDTLGFETADIVNALAFIDEKAAELGQPYVVNLSLGTIVSSHDGRSLEEQAIDTLFGPGQPGKAVVVAAGNSGMNGSLRYPHISGTTNVGLAGEEHVLQVPEYAPNPGRGNDRLFLTVWYRGRDRQRITVTTPGGIPVFAAFGTSVDFPTPEGNVLIANSGSVSPENGDVEAIVLIDDWAGTSPAAGAWKIEVAGEDIGDSGDYDAWLSDDSTVGATAPYFSDKADNQYLVGKPGGAFYAITVGSYAHHEAGTRFRTNWMDVDGTPRTDPTATPGEISTFSSPGPMRDGRVKPEIAAPGERVIGAVSQDAFPLTVPTSVYRAHTFENQEALLLSRNPTTAFGLLQGTSFAAPVVTGLVARILSRNPALDAVQIRNILINSAVSDGFTRAVPNAAWGYGKASLTVGATAAPLPATLLVTTPSLPAASVGAGYDQVFAASGGTPPYTWSVSAGTLPSGLTLNESGLVSGVTAMTGHHPFTVQVTDHSVPPRTAARAFELEVTNAAPLRVTTQVLPPAHTGLAYEATLEASGGTPPYRWTLAGGSLPTGLTIGSTGLLAGTASVPGRASFSVRVQDSAGGEAVGSLRVRVTRDGADLWEPLGESRTEVTRLAVDPDHPDHLLAATLAAFDGEANAVFESDDAGESWHSISIHNGFYDGAVFREAAWLTFNPADSVPWGARDRNVLRYDAAARTWITRKTDCGDTTVIDFDDQGNIYLFCSRTRTFFKSTTGGAEWTTTGQLCGGPPKSLSIENAGMLTVPRAQPAYLYVTREAEDGWYTCRSADGGATWTAAGTSPLPYAGIQVSQTDPLDVIRGGNGVIERSVDGGVTWTVRSAVSGAFTKLYRAPGDPATLLIDGGPTGLRRSTDFGQSWTPIAVRGSTEVESPAVAFHPDDANRFYVGTDRGIAYTADGGLTWSAKNRNLLRHPMSGVAVSPARPEELFLTTAFGQGYLSRTAGERWTAANIRLPGDQAIFELYQPTISAAEPSLYYARTDTDLLRSTDAGVSWTAVGPCNSCLSIESDAFDADPKSGAVLVATNTGEIYRSLDRGTTWALGDAPGASPVADFTFAHDPAERVYAVLEDGTVHRSEAAGLSWGSLGPVEDVDHLQPAPSDSRYLYAWRKRGTTLRYFDPAVNSWQAPAAPPAGKVIAIAVAWDSPLDAYAGVEHPQTAGSKGGLYKTTDGGSHWTRVAGLLDSYGIVSIALHPNDPDTIYAATKEDGVFKTKDGGATWNPLDRFGTVGEVVNVTVRHPLSQLIFAGTRGYGVQVSTDDGVTFAPASAGLTNRNVNAIAFHTGDSSTTIYAGTDDGIFKSTNNGAQWTATAQTTGAITDLVTHNDPDNEASGTRRIWGTVKGAGVAYSADGGNTFTVYNSGLASLDLTSLELQTIQGTRRIWGSTLGGHGVVYSDDDGETWKPGAGSGLTSRDVSDLAIEGSGTRRIWGTTADGVFYSDDHAQSWKELSLGLPSGVLATSVSIDPKTNETLVSLASDGEGGIYRGGNTRGIWSPFSDGLDELKVQRLTNDGRRDGATTTFYAATAGDGAYRIELPSTGGTGSLAISTTQLPKAFLRKDYSTSVAATGGVAPYQWSISRGFLPAGLALDPVTGVISGTPARIETATFDVQVSDGNSHIARQSLTIVTSVAKRRRSVR